MSDRDLAQRIDKWLKSDRHAIAWVYGLLEVLSLWDDLIDQDKRPNTKQINEAFAEALLWMPANPFYQQNQAVLHPLLVTGYRNWQASNQFEATDDDYMHSIAFVIRSSYVDAIAQCAACLGGYEHSLQVAIEARVYFHGERFEGYKAALAKERRDRACAGAESLKPQ